MFFFYDGGGGLASLFPFQCNLFKVVPSANNAAGQCLVCKKNGEITYCKGKNSCNYNLHLKVKNWIFYTKRIFFTMQHRRKLPFLRNGWSFGSSSFRSWSEKCVAQCSWQIQNFINFWWKYFGREKYLATTYYSSRICF